MGVSVSLCQDEENLTTAHEVKEGYMGDCVLSQIEDPCIDFSQAKNETGWSLRTAGPRASALQAKAGEPPLSARRRPEGLTLLLERRGRPSPPSRGASTSPAASRRHLPSDEGFFSAPQVSRMSSRSNTDEPLSARNASAVFASTYVAVPGDEVDERVQHYARLLPLALGRRLRICRKAPGIYEIGPDTVVLEWGHHEDLGEEVLVFRRDCVNPDGTVIGEALPYYLRHSANIAYELQFGGSMTQVPQWGRLSFQVEGTSVTEDNIARRLEAMAMATCQAKERELAAQAWRSRSVDSDGPPRSLDSLGEVARQSPIRGLEMPGLKLPVMPGPAMPFMIQPMVLSRVQAPPVPVAVPLTR